MAIDEVMAGAAGDQTIQFVELKMQSLGQNLVSGTVLRFYNGTGVETGTFTFPSNVSSNASGSSILIGTAQFVSAASVEPDFLMAAVINPTDGRVCFTDSGGSFVVDCVAYGDFTPSNKGFGTPAPALPTSGNSSLKRVSDTNDNSADFTLGTPAPRNNAGESGTVTPPDEPTPEPVFSIADMAVDEGGGVATLTISSDIALSTNVAVDYATSDGAATAPEDYTATSGTASLLEGTTSATISILIVSDAIDESDETFTVTLSNPKGGAISATAAVATVTILDDDVPMLSIGDETDNEAAGSVTMTVTSDIAPAVDVTVDF